MVSQQMGSTKRGILHRYGKRRNDCTIRLVCVFYSDRGIGIKFKGVRHQKCNDKDDHTPPSGGKTSDDDTAKEDTINVPEKSILHLLRAGSCR